MTAIDLTYDVRPYRPGDREQVLALLQQALAGGPTGERTEEFLRWKHELNPFGHSVALVAEEKGEVIGFRTFLRWRFRSGGRTIDAVRAVDTATHPDHQRRGIFTRLTLSGIEAIGRDAAFVFNTPNEKSLPGYLKMGWQRVGTVPIAIRPVRPLRFARGLRRAGRGGPSGPPPDSRLPSASELLLEHGDAVQALLEDATPESTRLTTDRSLDYLRWRYAQAPGLDYRIVAVWSDDGLEGLAIGRPRRRGPLAEFVLSEVLIRPGDASTARRLLRAAARSGCDHVAVLVRGDRTLQRAGMATGYVSVPRVGMTLTCRPLDSVNPGPVRPEFWNLSLGDLEVF